MELSKRLSCVADMVSPATCCADVGCDHAFLSIYLIKNDICKHMIAMDVNEGPLKRAKDHVAEENLEESIEVRLSDGLEKLTPGEADECVIAGMGGPLGLRILYDGKDKVTRMNRVVLQLQSEPAVVRYVLKEWGFKTESEKMTCDDGKFYTVMSLIPPKQFADCDITTWDNFIAEIKGKIKEKDTRTRTGLTFGKKILEEKPEVFVKFLDKEEERLGDIYECLGEKNSFTNRERMQEIEKEIEVCMYARGILAGM